VGEHSVSILIETANLSSAELKNLADCLESLARQTHPIGSVREAIVLQAADDPAAIEEICSGFPWVQVRNVAPGTGYGDVKAQSAVQAAGELVVLCDADCVYEPDWLERMIEALGRDGVQIVGGETTTPVSGPYSLAVALTFVFPRFSGERELAPSLWYWANNVAFHRSFFEAVPLPSRLPLYRGQNVVHARLLEQAGQRVWRAPRARAFHQLPLRSELLRRYELFGHDMVTLARLVEDRGGRHYRMGIEPGAPRAGRARHFAARARSVFAEDPRRLCYAPAALPIVLAGMAAYGAGMIRAHAEALVPALRRAAVARAR
jgi:glycosyltransferase involved in cell wall biosynthesis